MTQRRPRGYRYADSENFKKLDCNQHEGKNSLGCKHVVYILFKMLKLLYNILLNTLLLRFLMWSNLCGRIQTVVADSFEVISQVRNWSEMFNYETKTHSKKKLEKLLNAKINLICLFVHRYRDKKTKDLD